MNNRTDTDYFGIRVTVIEAERRIDVWHANQLGTVMLTKRPSAWPGEPDVWRATFNGTEKNGRLIRDVTQSPDKDVAVASAVAFVIRMAESPAVWDNA